MFGLVTRRRYEQDLADARAQIARQRDRAEQAEDRAATAEYNRGQLLEQLAEADAANRRLHGRNQELSDRLTARIAADPERAAALTRRVDRLRRIVSRLLAEQRAEKRRADHLQRRLDDACGLTTSGITDSSPWQPGYQAPAVGAS